MAVAYGTALWVRFGNLDALNPEYFDYYVQMGVVQCLIWGLISRGGMHDWEPGWGWKETVLPFLRAVGLHLALTALLLVFLKFTVFSRWFWVLHYGAFLVLALTWRTGALAVLRRRWSDANRARSVWVLGDTPAAKRFLDAVSVRPDWSLRVAVHLPHPASRPGDASLSEELPFALYVALPGNDPRIPVWLHWAESRGVRFRYLPDLGDWGGRRAELHTDSGLPVVELRPEPLAQPVLRWTKRGLDCAVALGAILLLGWWLIPLAALLMQWESPGPVFFKQKRHGYGGRTFVLWKLRTLKPNLEADRDEVRAGDPRMTRVGAWLRRLSIDEFPQFFQVLAGTLSVVGPRPHMTAQTAEFQRRVSGYALRHWVKPGLTGLAQVRGYKGDSSDQELLDRRIQADVYYVENASLLLDLQILAETAWFWITGRGGAPRPKRSPK